MYACYIVFNAEQTLEESLNSIVPYVEKVVIIDGAFRDYPHKFPYSTDQTKEIAVKVCGEKLIWIDCGAKAWIGQVTKRNEYLKHVPIGEWFIVIDADEVLKGNLRYAFRTALRHDRANYYTCLGIKIVNFRPKCGDDLTGMDAERWSSVEWVRNVGVGTRLYRKVKGMTYRTHHSKIYCGMRLVSRSQKMVHGVELVNLKCRKTLEEYQKGLIYRERRPKPDL